MCKLLDSSNVLKFFNDAYLVGHQGILIRAFLNRTCMDLQKVSPLCINELRTYVLHFEPR